MQAAYNEARRTFERELEEIDAQVEGDEEDEVCSSFRFILRWFCTKGRGESDPPGGEGLDHPLSHRTSRTPLELQRNTKDPILNTTNENSRQKI